MKKYLITLIVVVVAIVGGLSYYKSSLVSSINSFESCVKAQNPVLESYPRQCRTSDGRSFTEDVSVEQSLIHVTTPLSGSSVTSPLTVKGEARGVWYFEASFPVRLLDESGKEIAVAPAQAQGDWMTEDFVPFEVTLSFPTTTGFGTLVLQKDNPSGLPEHDDMISIPVVFGTKSEPSSCRVTGCSGQICSDTDVVTNCLFKEEYACYKKARCERQVSGQCGWTETDEFKSCISSIVQ